MDFLDLSKIFALVTNWDDLEQTQKCLGKIAEILNIQLLSYNFLSTDKAKQNEERVTITWPQDLASAKGLSPHNANSKWYDINHIEKIIINDEGNVFDALGIDAIPFEFLDVHIIPVFDPIGRKGVFLAGQDPQLVSPLSSMFPGVNILQSFHIEFTKNLQKLLYPIHKISPREIEVLGLLTKGFTNSEIAEILSLSRFTVNGYLKAIGLKLDADNRVKIALKAISAGIV